MKTQITFKKQKHFGTSQKFCAAVKKGKLISSSKDPNAQYILGEDSVYRDAEPAATMV